MLNRSKIGVHFFVAILLPPLALLALYFIALREFFSIGYDYSLLNIAVEDYLLASFMKAFLGIQLIRLANLVLDCYFETLKFVRNYYKLEKGKTDDGNTS